MDPISGLHRNVAVMDYASLYPNTIMSFNLSPDTFIISQVKAE
jgi:DNA polymerase I